MLLWVPITKKREHDLINVRASGRANGNLVLFKRSRWICSRNTLNVLERASHVGAPMRSDFSAELWAHAHRRKRRSTLRQTRSS